MRHDEALSELTVLPEKERYYRGEMFFREAWGDFEAVAGDQVHDLLALHGLILFKPDGLVGGVVEKALDILDSLGFEPVGGAIVQLDRHSTRWLWLYRFNVASVERVLLHDRINTAGPSLLVVLRDRRAVPGKTVPGSVRLTDCKGPSRPERRRPDQLRTRLGVEDRLLNFVHTSDEPADLVREFGILLTSGERRSLLKRITEGKSWVEWLAEHQPLLRAQPPRSFDPAIAVASLQRTAEAMEQSTSSEVERRRWAVVCANAAAAVGGDDAARSELWRRIEPMTIDVDPWDLISIGAREIEFDEPGLDEQTLGDAPPAKWLVRMNGGADGS